MRGDGGACVPRVRSNAARVVRSACNETFAWRRDEAPAVQFDQAGFRCGGIEAAITAGRARLGQPIRSFCIARRRIRGGTGCEIQ
ncbi:hypothetical protein WS68_06770 [Burkholderia sp. TSV86]|nr:hypothetical protein WS68_06770 [Burkholderia sp. TSV86]